MREKKNAYVLPAVREKQKADMLHVIRVERSDSKTEELSVIKHLQDTKEVYADFAIIL